MARNQATTRRVVENNNRRGLMRSKLLNPNPPIAYAIVLDTGDEVMGELRNWDETIESTEKNQDHGKNAIKESRYRYFKSGDVGILRR